PDKRVQTIVRRQKRLKRTRAAKLAIVGDLDAADIAQRIFALPQGHAPVEAIRDSALKKHAANENILVAKERAIADAELVGKEVFAFQRGDETERVGRELFETPRHLGAQIEGGSAKRSGN